MSINGSLEIVAQAAEDARHDRATQLEAARQALERAKTALQAAQARVKAAHHRLAAGSPATVLAAAEAEVATQAQQLRTASELHQELLVQDVRSSYRERRAEHLERLAQYRENEAERERLVPQIQMLKAELVAKQHRLTWLERNTESGPPSGAALRAFTVQHCELLRAAGDLSQEDWEQLNR